MMNKFFPLKHWFLSVLPGTFLSALFMDFGGGAKSLSSFIELLYIGLWLAFVYSLPALLLHYLTFWGLTKSAQPLKTKKIILIAEACIGLLLSFIFMGFRMDSAALAGCFLLAIVGTGALLRLGKGGAVL